MFNGNNLERMITAVVALLLIVGSLVITILSAIHVATPQVPQWLLSATTLVLGYYFGHYRAGLPMGGGSTTGTGADVQQTLAVNQGQTTTTNTTTQPASTRPMSAGNV